MNKAQHDQDQYFMNRALTLAARGMGMTSPNPMVGCVIVKNGHIIAEGWHKGRGWHGQDGLFHAEIEALRAAGSNTKGATAYVTLEPCNHHGSTPPCSQALIDANIARVVYAMADPNKLAAGGAEHLNAHHIETQQGPLTHEAQFLNRNWLHILKTKSPYVIAKYAASLDGKIATQNGESKWITGEKARSRAHDLRHWADAIIVGAQTVIVDDPSLTVRGEDRRKNQQGGFSHPVRVILDSYGRTSPSAKVYNAQTPGRALLITTQQAADKKINTFRDHNIEVEILPADNQGHPCLHTLSDFLVSKNLTTIMVEGGAKILGSFFDANLVNEVWAFIAPVIIGGKGRSAIENYGADNMASALRLTDLQQEFLEPDILMRGLIPPSQQQMEAPCLQAS